MIFLLPNMYFFQNNGTLFCCIFSSITVWTPNKCSFLLTYSQWSLRQCWLTLGQYPCLSIYCLNMVGHGLKCSNILSLCPQRREDATEVVPILHHSLKVTLRQWQAWCLSCIWEPLLRKHFKCGHIKLYSWLHFSK